MLNRLDGLYEDIIASLTDEIDKINAALERSPVDKKDPCKVLRAIRLPILSNVECSGVGGTIEYDTSDPLEFREYNGLFDDFHYDIGHGKGTGNDSNGSGNYGDVEISHE